MTASDHSRDDREGRPPTERRDRPTAPLEEPAASRATLARRLRAVERALAGTEGVELEGVEFESGAVPEDDLGAVEDRLDALSRAVGAIGECLVARGRARRTDDGTESVRRAVEALPDAADGETTADTAIRDGTSGIATSRTVLDGSPDSVVDESPAEWLDRVAAGGVTPPPAE